MWNSEEIAHILDIILMNSQLREGKREPWERGWWAVTTYRYLEQYHRFVVMSVPFELFYTAKFFFLQVEWTLGSSIWLRTTISTFMAEKLFLIQITICQPLIYISIKTLASHRSVYRDFSSAYKHMTQKSDISWERDVSKRYPIKSLSKPKSYWYTEIKDRERSGKYYISPSTC